MRPIHNGDPVTEEKQKEAGDEAEAYAVWNGLICGMMVGHGASLLAPNLPLMRLRSVLFLDSLMMLEHFSTKLTK